MLPIKFKSLSAQIGFITYHRTLQFYMIPEGASQASQLVVGNQIRLLMKCQKQYLGRLVFLCLYFCVGDVDDIFLPSPCDLLVNLQACKEQVGHSSVFDYFSFCILSFLISSVLDTDTTQIESAPVFSSSKKKWL